MVPPKVESAIPAKAVIRADSIYGERPIACIIIESDSLESPEVICKEVPEEIDDNAEKCVYSLLLAMKIARERDYKEIELLTPRASIAELANVAKKYHQDYDVVDKKYWYKFFRAMELFAREERIIHITHDATTATLLTRRLAELFKSTNLKQWGSSENN